MKTISKAKTAVQLAKELADRNMHEVCRSVGLSEEIYCAHQLQQYEEFLKIMFHGYPVEMLNEARYSPIMAGFWKNEWNWRNANDFLPLAKDELESFMWINEDGILEAYEPSEFTVRILLDEYKWANCAQKLIHCDQFMNGYNTVLKLIRQSNKS